MVGLTLSIARFSVTTGSVPVFSRQPSSALYTIRSASWRLPRARILLMSWVTSGELYTGSAFSGRRGAGPLRGMSALLLLRAVAAAGLLAVAHALSVQRATNDLVADTGEVLHPAAAHEHDRVLLQVVADARDVGGDLDRAGEPHARHLAQRRVRLLGRGGVHARAHAPPLGAPLQRRRLRLRRLRLAALADQLLDCGHRVPVSLRPRGRAFSFVLLVPSALVAGPARRLRAVPTRRRPPRSGVSSDPQGPTRSVTHRVDLRAAPSIATPVGARTSCPAKPGTRGKSTHHGDAGQNGLAASGTGRFSADSLPAETAIVCGLSRQQGCYQPDGSNYNAGDPAACSGDGEPESGNLTARP